MINTIIGCVIGLILSFINKNNLLHFLIEYGNNLIKYNLLWISSLFKNRYWLRFRYEQHTIYDLNTKRIHHLDYYNLYSR
jgi:hypothetical protein